MGAIGQRRRRRRTVPDRGRCSGRFLQYLARAIGQDCCTPGETAAGRALARSAPARPRTPFHELFDPETTRAAQSAPAGLEYSEDFLSVSATACADRPRRIVCQGAFGSERRGAKSAHKILHAVGAEVAGSSEWPNWREGNEFRAVRDASRAAQ